MRGRIRRTPSYNGSVPIFHTYAKRRRSGSSDSPEPLRYEPIPPELRRQVIHISQDAIGPFIKNHNYMRADYAGNERWVWIHKTMAKEMGVFDLGDGKSDPYVQCQQFLLNADTDDALSIIELTFWVIAKIMVDVNAYGRREQDLEQTAEDAIEELNGRFAEQSFGYRFENEQIVRIDSELLHREATVPAIVLLREEGFGGALDEFMEAHRHYRKGEAKDANVDAFNALESTLKTICDRKNWNYAKGATATDLMKLVIRQGLIPPELQGQFEHLIKAMQTGLPPVRHNFGGHGQGAEPKTVADHLAAYSLHLMAANIVLLIEAYRVARYASVAYTPARALSASLRCGMLCGIYTETNIEDWDFRGCIWLADLRPRGRSLPDRALRDCRRSGNAAPGCR